MNNLTTAASTILRDNKSEGGESDSTHSSASDKTPSLVVDTSTPTTIPDYIEDIDEIDTYTNHPLVERAFEVRAIFCSVFGPSLTYVKGMRFESRREAEIRRI